MSNPDVEELRRYNDDACTHEEVEERSVAVGAGWPLIGCHMERRIVCKACGKSVPFGARELRELLETPEMKQAIKEFEKAHANPTTDTTPSGETGSEK